MATPLTRSASVVKARHGPCPHQIKEAYKHALIHSLGSCVACSSCENGYSLTPELIDDGRKTNRLLTREKVATSVYALVCVDVLGAQISPAEAVCPPPFPDPTSLFRGIRPLSGIFPISPTKLGRPTAASDFGCDIAHLEVDHVVAAETSPGRRRYRPSIPDYVRYLNRF